ncbi:two-component sensor histidine kinase [Malaciobacter molluscorum LMG 25693]|uniref:histidine kinase n=2 Tax=Malaciobacter molluscorum TaxID=1032072 RepID=A0A2G1DKJ3_9BACT|nr:two-component system sensor histidine kinase [Malaciobacter molluscorum LMG 25693]PHO19018.1 two-component sensor histidine kinase [Malaciobacter molluscorum LMG 25693]RXJ97325.1 two-component sensor histidine kinase [Malaciobacter molluscorum]
MLALKDLDIDLIRSEKKTLIRFSLLYLSLCCIILLFIGYIFYFFQKDLMLEKQRIKLQDYSSDFIYRLKDLHINFDKYKYYPRDERYKSAIYDSSKKKIFSTLDSNDIKFNKVIYLTNDKIHYITQPESYYLGAKYIVIEIPEDKSWLEKLEKTLTFINAVVFLFMLFIGYFLLNIVLKPMKQSMYILDRFIKDTTHELNTPVSTIVTNIEMIKQYKLEEKLKNKINRIDIGAKTISNIYDDLTYLTLNNKIISRNEDINLSVLLEQRVEFFSTLAQAKKIDFVLNISDNIYINMDKKKLSKLIDNLLSNAIKYNKIKGLINVSLEEGCFKIEDSGQGMSQEQLKKLFIRYTRFDKSVGGFGIGLSIVSLIAKEYKLKVDFSSKLKEGTKVEVKW